jgi:hypothetical protein
MNRILIAIAVFLGITMSCRAEPRAEIEALIQVVRSLEGSVFIRNGSEHTPMEAADHLKLKWTKQSKKINTAEDFIALCATKSIMSGSAYTIRFADGREEESADFLKSALNQIRAPNPDSRTSR